MKQNPNTRSRKKTTPAKREHWLYSLLDIILKFRRYAKDVLSVVLILVSLLTLLAFIGLTSGGWITPWANLLSRWFGWGSVFFILACGVAGLFLLQRDSEPLSRQDWRKIIWLELSAFSIMALMSIFGGNSIERAEIGLDGGVVGWGLSEFMRILLSALPPSISSLLRILIFLLVAVFGILFGFQLAGRVIDQLEKLLEKEEDVDLERYSDPPAVVIAGGNEPILADTEKKKTKSRSSVLPPEYRKEFKVDQPADERVTELDRDHRLPPLELLQVGSGFKPSERHINQTAGLIEKTLAEFGIPSKVVGFKVGPTVTQFALEPGYLDRSSSGNDNEENRQKVRVAQISGLRRDLALALSVERLRIQAPVPGRPYVGIEVPNEKSVIVGLRSILESESFYQVSSPLAIALGRDVSGFPVVADLIKMPHLLIAGTTGSGKSVCIAALTACLVMNNTPEELQLVMIDPKMVELVRFNGLPHLIGKVETDLERISAVLKWVVIEMQERYKLLEELRARDIDSYNRKVKRRKDYGPLPRIVVMIDELADLMMSSAEQTETTLVRLAQMARATGIHLVIATQRPSTDVVTGLIKANFPARISFAVASGVDSRVILDSAGAETLLGRGDMLFLNPEEGTPIRAQGVHLSDKEIEKIIAFWQQEWAMDDEKSPWEEIIDSKETIADRDDLVDEAIELLAKTGKASTSMLQRRLRIGYPRAARLMDELEDLGIVGPSRGGGKERDILVDYDKDNLE